MDADARCPDGFMRVSSKYCFNNVSAVLIGIAVVAYTVMLVWSWWKERKEKATGGGGGGGGGANEQTFTEWLRELIGNPRRAFARGAFKRYMFAILAFGMLFYLLSIYRSSLPLDLKNVVVQPEQKQTHGVQFIYEDHMKDGEWQERLRLWAVEQAERRRQEEELAKGSGISSL